MIPPLHVVQILAKKGETLLPVEGINTDLAVRV
jgi:hypothetical protein